MSLYPHHIEHLKRGCRRKGTTMHANIASRPLTKTPEQIERDAFLARAFEQGEEACTVGKPITHNPYGDDLAAFARWSNGYTSQQYVQSVDGIDPYDLR